MTLKRVPTQAFDVPFPMRCAVDEGVRQAQMAISLRHRLPKLWPVPMDETRTASLACFGPSLAETWQNMERPIIAMSGAHDFLIERGIVPDYYVSMDPRTSALPHLQHPHPEVQYLLASVSHPFVWPMLRGYDVKTFHVVSGANTYAWLQVHDPRSLLIVAGSSVGLGSIHVGGVLGFRHFEVYGMDGCYHGTQRHAGDHYGHAQPPIPWSANGRTWQTSKIMINSAVELLNMLREFPFFVVLHGTGLQQDLVADADLPNAALAGTAKADAVRGASIEIVVGA